MADTKITALTALTGADPANDVIPIVDVSDTTMAASGTTKKISVNNILGASGTATLASATITGDLTVDTSTLKVDSANNVVGITNASPLTGTDGGLTLGVIGSSKAMAISMFNCFARLRERDAINNFAITTNIDTTNAVLDDNTRTSWKVRFGSGNDNFLIQRAAIGSTTFQDLYSVSTTSAVWSDGAGGTRMTLNSTGLGIGSGPGLSGSSRRALTVNSGAGQISILELAVNSTLTGYLFSNTTQTSLVSQGATYITFDTNSNERMRIDSSGNVGIGVTSPAYKLDVNGVARVSATGGDGVFLSSSSATDLYVVGVNYLNNNGTEVAYAPTRPSWKIEHKNSTDATAYVDIGFRAANAAASAFTSRFKIDGSGNVISNVTGTAPTLATNSQMVFNLTSNTNLRISVCGTDGVTRTANITLA